MCATVKLVVLIPGRIGPVNTRVAKPLTRRPVGRNHTELPSFEQFPVKSQVYLVTQSAVGYVRCKVVLTHVRAWIDAAKIYVTTSIRNRGVQQ